MILTKGTVKLRAIEETDMDFCREMINSSYIESCTIGKNYPVSTKQQIEWFRNYDQNREIRLIIENETTTFGMLIANNINWINRNCEVGIKLLTQESINPNETLDACKLFLDYLFNELNMNCVYAYILEENRLAYKLLTRLCFSEEGVLRQRVFKQGVYHNAISFSILRNEYSGGANE